MIIRAGNRVFAMPATLNLFSLKLNCHFCHFCHFRLLTFGGLALQYDMENMTMNFLELAKKRLSCRDYLDKPVPSEALAYCLEAARLAPSACNQQPWRFIIVEDPELRGKLSKEALLPGLPMPWVASAPVIAVLCAKKKIGIHGIAPMVSGIHYHLIDLGIAGEHFILAAAEQELGTCWIGWFKAKAVRKILDLPKSLEPVSLITLGYPASPMTERARLTLSEMSEFR